MSRNFHFTRKTMGTRCADENGTTWILVFGKGCSSYGSEYRLKRRWSQKVASLLTHHHVPSLFPETRDSASQSLPICSHESMKNTVQTRPLSCVNDALVCSFYQNTDSHILAQSGQGIHPDSTAPLFSVRFRFIFHFLQGNRLSFLLLGNSGDTILHIWRNGPHLFMPLIPI